MNRRCFFLFFVCLFVFDKVDAQHLKLNSSRVKNNKTIPYPKEGIYFTGKENKDLSYLVQKILQDGGHISLGGIKRKKDDYTLNNVTYPSYEVIVKDTYMSGGKIKFSTLGIANYYFSNGKLKFIEFTDRGEVISVMEDWGDIRIHSPKHFQILKFNWHFYFYPLTV